MRLKHCLPFILFFLLIPSATAFINEDINVTAPWAVAGGPSVPIQIHVENATLTKEAADYTNVKLTVTASTLGTVEPKEINLDIYGNATLYFTPDTVKGVGNASIFVYYNETFQNTKIANIHIDHAEPKKWALLTHDSPVTVNTITSIKIRLNDIYGNSVENLTGDPHTISFMDS